MSFFAVVATVAVEAKSACSSAASPMSAFVGVGRAPPFRRIAASPPAAKDRLMVGGTTVVAPPGRIPPPPMPSSSSALAGWFGIGNDSASSTKTKTKSKAENAATSINKGAVVKAGERVGSGSYGTVHSVTLEGNDGDSSTYIGKRAWTYEELLEKAQELKEEKEAEGAKVGSGGSSAGSAARGSSGGSWTDSESSVKDRADRCSYYIDVERHCLTKLKELEDERTAAARRECVAELVGTCPDEEGRDWLVFETVPRGTGYGGVGVDDDGENAGKTTVPALSLADAMDLDWADQHALDPTAGDDQHHHLYIVQREMGLPHDSTFSDTLDAVFRGLLRATAACHSGNVVHRDVKPANLLCDARHKGFVLIDFGSAADMDPKKGPGGLVSALGGNGGRVGLEDEGRVAVSPIYSAPETFVRWDRAPLNFDAFSTALIFFQLLFNLLDERTDAAFRTQLELGAKYDLDLWLENEFESTLVPAGVDDAFAYLAERPGLWRLLKDMLNDNPELRTSSVSALRRFDAIVAAADKGDRSQPDKADGEFFVSFLSSMDLYEAPPAKEEEEAKATAATATTVAAEDAFIAPRPLHYVATFERAYPLGLILSEVGAEDEDEGDEDADKDSEAEEAWARATRGAKPGEVYVKGVAEGGQADVMGIFEVGDRLRAVGEVPVFDKGFEYAVDMIGNQPRSAKTVKLHFDRRSVGRSHKYKEGAAHKARVVGQGAWSSIGRRTAQEDAFVLHEIHDGKDNDVLMAAIFDGHGGAAASSSASQILPSLFSAELTTLALSGKSADLRTVLETTWDITCDGYRSGCTDSEECVADYDPREGIVLASMTSKDLVAGTTAAVAILSVAEEGADTMTILNCGDSRSLLVGRSPDSPKESVVHFATRDHCPADELEIERLRLGKDQGYSQPKRSMSRWRVPVGDYSYALSRSLEGPFATSKGIVSDPDVTDVDLVEMLSEREDGTCTLIVASDGMFEVMDNEQVGREVLNMRKNGMTANDAAKYICRLANEKNTSDNVSAVVVYLD